MRKKKRPENDKKKRNVRKGRPKTQRELVKRKIVSCVISRPSKTRKLVWPQPRPNKTLMQRSLHAKKKNAG